MQIEIEFKEEGKNMKFGHKFFVAFLLSALLVWILSDLIPINLDSTKDTKEFFVRILIASAFFLGAINFGEGSTK